jgi:hypothetical protein
MNYINTHWSDYHDGISHHGVKVRTTIHALMHVLGEPSDYNNSGEEKSNIEWYGMLNDEIAFSVYDWKEYRQLEEDGEVMFHIGANDYEQSRIVRNWLINQL